MSTFADVYQSALTRLRSYSRPNLVPSKGSKEDEEMKAEFSTADRKFLSELRQDLSSKESRFIMKNGKKHHPFSIAEVPYPRSYDRLVLDQYVFFPRSPS